MWLDYPTLIQESKEELKRLERQHRGQPTEARVRMLRLLKRGEVRSLRRGAEWLGYSSKQLERWWQRYEAGGLTALLEVHRPPGKGSRLTAEARAGLEEEMRQGKIGRLEEMRRYLKEHWGIEYGSLNGIWWMMRRFKVKLKTGRRRHQQADVQAQEGFKKN